MASLDSPRNPTSDSFLCCLAFLASGLLLGIPHIILRVVERGIIREEAGLLSREKVSNEDYVCVDSIVVICCPSCSLVQESLQLNTPYQKV